MITEAQQRWLDHLSDKDIVTIVPFDPTSEEKFQEIKKRVKAILGEDITIEHHGASSLGISGQNEIDIYIPISPDQFDPLTKKLSNALGEPASLYVLERARFRIRDEQKHIDVFVINKEHSSWTNSVKFEDYLRSNTNALEQYRELKEDGNGLNVREYYRRKIEFINNILELTN